MPITVNEGHTSPGRWAPAVAVLIVAALILILTSSGLNAKAVTRTAAAGPVSIVVNDNKAGTPVNRNLFGANYSVFYRDQTNDPSSQTLWPTAATAAQSMGLRLLRMSPAVNLQYCGGGDCTYHWWKATAGTGHSDDMLMSYQMSPDQWMKNVQTMAGPSAAALINVNVEAGTVSEAQDWVAYMNGSPSSGQLLQDGTTVGHWAQMRVANGRTAPWGVHFWEIGNEEFNPHVCLTGKNAAGCVNNPPLTCILSGGLALYGCIVANYGAAMKAVDPSIGIVVGYGGQGNFSAVGKAAASVTDAIDAHQYGVLVDPYGTTFDTDGQSATYTVTDTTNSVVNMVTFGLWMNATGPAHVDVYMDNALLPTTSFSVAASNTAVAYSLGRNETSAGTHTHTMRVVACDNKSVVYVCLSQGHHPAVYLHHITATLGNVTAATLNGAVGCMAGTDNLQYLNGQSTPTILEDTRVPTTTGQTGGIAAPGAPWRLSADSDFPIAYTAGEAAFFASDSGAFDTHLGAWRIALANSGYGSTPLIIGEYAGFGGCTAAPADQAVDQSSAIWSALTTASILQDRSASQPIIGAGVYEFHGGGGVGTCTNFSMLTTVLTNLNPCQGSNTAYLQPVGLAMAQFASLAGTLYPTTVTGAPTLNSYPTLNYFSVTAPSLSTVASVGTGTATVVIVNACPPGTAATPSQCGTAALPVNLTFGSGRQVTGASATTVAATPYADNTDAAPTAVSSQAVPGVTTSGGTASLTVPPFSVTTVTVTF